MNPHSGFLRRCRRDAVAEAILDAAESVIARRGWQRTTIHHIAAQAGCAGGTLYLYFANKEELLQALFARLNDELDARMMAALQGGGAPLQRIRRAVETVLEHCEKHGSSLDVVFLPERGRARRLGHPPTGVFIWPPRAWAGQRLNRALLQATLKAVSEAQARGEVRDDFAPRQVLQFMHGVLTGMLGHWRLSGKAPAREEQMRLLWGFLTGGICSREGKKSGER